MDCMDRMGTENKAKRSPERNEAYSFEQASSIKSIRSIQSIAGAHRCIGLPT